MVMMLVVAAHAGELSLKAVPKPITQTVTARFKNAKMVGAGVEKTPEGKVVYEVSLEERGRNIDVSLTPEGAIFLIEKEIAYRDLPKAVVDSLQRLYPKARYAIVEQVYEVEGGKETLAHYEAIFRDAKKQAWAVELTADGKVLEAEKRSSIEEAKD